MSGILYIVGTPIGNLEDMTWRAVRVLQEVDLIAAEDTRHTGKLLQHFQIARPQVSYYEHNKSQRLGELLQRLEQGQNIALVSDAGMPGISDPGYELIKACVDANIEVRPIPGVTAAITALASSGLPTERFVFEGFLPTKAKLRRDRLIQLQSEPRTMILYEAPHRVQETLADLARILGPERPVTLARELTKRFEEFWRGTLGEAIAHYQENPPKGEFTLVLGGSPEATTLNLSEEELKKALQQLLHQGLSRSQASRQLAKDTSFSRQEIYQWALSLPDPIEEEIPPKTDHISTG